MFRPLCFCSVCLMTLAFASVVAAVLGLAGELDVSVLPIAAASAVFAAFYEGQHAARTRRFLPAKDLIWLTALGMTAMVALIFDAIYAGFLLWQPGQVASLGQIPPLTFGISLLILAAVTCIVLRFTYEAGLKSVFDQRPHRSR